MKKKQKCLIKIGDKIKIITGDYKGVIGTINTILFKKSIGILNKFITKKLKIFLNG